MKVSRNNIVNVKLFNVPKSCRPKLPVRDKVRDINDLFSTSPRGSLVRNDCECVAAVFCILSFRQGIESWDSAMKPNETPQLNLSRMMRQSLGWHVSFEISFFFVLSFLTADQMAALDAS